MLSTKRINDSSINEAASEVLSNINLLVIAGYVEEAYLLTSAMLKSGPWEVNPHTAQIDHVQRIHQLLCWLLGKDCPSIGGEKSISKSEFPEIANHRWNSVLTLLVMSDRLQTGEVGEGWCKNYFDSLMEMKKENCVFREYWEFVNDVDWVIKLRLRNKLDIELPNLFPEEIEGHEVLHRTDEEIFVSPNTDAFDSQWLTDKVAECSNLFNQKNGFNNIGYMEERIFVSQLIFDILDDDEESTVRQMERLMFSKNMPGVMEIFYWPELRSKLLNTDFRIITNLDDDIVTGYIEVFETRRSIHGERKSKNTSYTLEECVGINEFSGICRHTCLDGLESVELPIPDSDQTVLIVRVDSGDILTMWEAARSLLDRTRRWPVFMLSWQNTDGNWKDDFIENLFFDRYAFQSEIFDGNRIGLSPENITEGAAAIELSDIYQRLAMKRYDGVKEFLSYQVDAEGNDNPELMSRIIQGLDDTITDRYRTASSRFYKCKFENDQIAALDTSYITWYEAANHESLFLVFLPTKNSWEVPAYVQWYGAERCGSEVVVAQLKDWHEHYGAEIVAHYGTMLQLTVGSKPKSLNEALDLAYVQDLLAPCSLSGTSIGEHALDLMQSDKWFLHDRP